MKNIFFKLIRFSGLPWLFREVLQRNKVTILMFHDLDAEKAANAFIFLKKHYTLIGLQDYLKMRHDGRSFPKKAAIITFDDGHAGNYKLLPIIQKLQIPVTIFLCSDIVGTHRHFWFKHCGNDSKSFKKLPNQVRLMKLKAFGYEQTREYEDVQALSRQQIDEMRPWVDFQAHTCFHPILPQCDDETAQKEIALCKQHLETDFSFHINALAYPNGDYLPRDIAFAKEAGFTCGITVEPGYNDMDSDLFHLKRLSVNDARTMDEMVVKASGCYAWMKKVINMH